MDTGLCEIKGAKCAECGKPMDNDLPIEETGAPVSIKPALPKGAAFLPQARAEADRPDETRRDLAISPAAPEERAGVFRQLVTDDGDIAGLVAYSIYKQNKLDWLNAFTAVKGRAPKDDELASYIIGEGTPRRLATYRHLAEATLAGNGPDIGGPAGEPRMPFRRAGVFGDRGGLSTGLVATYGVIAVLFIVVFLVAAHYTMSSR